MIEYFCARCGGFVGEPMKAYGYAGQWCHCKEPLRPQGNLTRTDVSGTTFIQICTCGNKCPIHDKIDQLSDKQASELDHDMWAGRGKM